MPIPNRAAEDACREAGPEKTEPIFIISSGTIVGCNDAAAVLVDLHPSAVTGWPFSQVFRPATEQENPHQYVDELLNGVLDSGNFQDIRGEVQFNTPHPILVSARLQPLLLEGQKRVLVSCHVPLTRRDADGKNSATADNL